jgi:hypothetical protein
MNVTKSCLFTLPFSCGYNLNGIQKLYIADTKESEFIIDNNILVDIVTATWYNIRTFDFKLVQNIEKNIEEIIIDFSVPYLDNNKKEISKIRDTYYSLLILTNNNDLIYIDSTKNTLYQETFNPNGVIIKQNSTQIKSLFIMDYNYYKFNFIGVEDVIDVCSSYYNDLALDSIQPNALSITCIVSDYVGWF